MLQVKLPYYPKIEATMSETKFGAIETTEPKIYDRPINGKIIVKVDTLDCLRELLGDECFICRELLYTILAGEHQIYNCEEVLASFYRKYSKITEYINEKYYYGDESVPLLERAVLPLREKVNDYYSKVVEQLSNSGGKYLLHTHDYVYYAFNTSAKLPDIKGAEIIC